MDNGSLDPISDLEKKLLKKRITKSVKKIKSKKRLRYALGAASSMALLASLSFYFMQPKEISIRDFVDSNKDKDVNQSENVVLILNENENIQIKEDSSQINYSKTGEKVNIGSKMALNQNAVKDDKVVFNTLLVPYGKRSNIKLSDGSKVWLNSGSKLIYPSVFKGSKREVYLEGEAIFDVAHNQTLPFKVISKDQEINVLGTVFNVTSYPDDNTTSTVLERGSVEIDYVNPKTKNIKLSPGNMAAYNKTTALTETKKVDVYNYFSWRDGVLIFRNNDLEYIMSKLSRYYNVQIKINENREIKETFSGYLDLKNNVENVIATIKETTDFDYEIVKNNSSI